VWVQVILVKGSPEEGANNASALNSTEGKVHSSHHILVLLVGQRDVAGRKGLGMICVDLEAKLLLSMPPCRERDSDLHQPHTADQVDAIGELGRSECVLAVYRSAGMLLNITDR
jgi:uncharacterized protein (DUF952 family)